MSGIESSLKFLKPVVLYMPYQQESDRTWQ